VKKLILLLIVIGFFEVRMVAQAQEERKISAYNNNTEPFLFSFSTLTPEDLKWSLDYSGSYGDEVEGSMGFEGVSQQLGIKGYLGARFTLYGNLALGFSEGNDVSSAQQVEVIRNFIGGKKYIGWRIGAGLGGRRDYSNDYSLLGRVTLEYIAPKWKAGGNLLFEKVFEEDRDAIDIITSLGVHYRFTGGFYGGIEAVGEDLEGFWDDKEAEGGAKLMVGPSLNLAPKDSRFSFSLSGGPVILATQNEASNPDAIRDLPSQAGLLIRAKIIFTFI
jgi:hypothetical protein